MIDKKLLLYLFNYDSKKGLLFWKNAPGSNYSRLKNKIAGCKYKEHGTTYLGTRINYQFYLIHTLIYFIETGVWAPLIDHKNGNGLDNRIENLRSVTYRQNNSNTYRHRAGKLVGSSYIKSKKKWMSHITINKKLRNLGYFSTELEAHLKYVSALKDLE